MYGRNDFYILKMFVIMLRWRKQFGSVITEFIECKKLILI